MATSTHPDDALLENYTLNGEAAFLRGSEDDVLQRFVEAADRYEADILLRVTGDCPVVSFEIADLLIRSHLQKKADVTYCGESIAVGTSSEVYSVDALRKLRRLMPDTSHSEYLILYFKNNPDYFKLNPVALPETYKHPEWRLTLDERADLDLFELLFKTVGIKREPVAFDQILKFFLGNPEAAKINANIKLRYVDDHQFASFLNKVTKINK